MKKRFLTTLFSALALAGLPSARAISIGSLDFEGAENGFFSFAENAGQVATVQDIAGADGTDGIAMRIFDDPGSYAGCGIGSSTVPFDLLLGGVTPGAVTVGDIDKITGSFDVNIPVGQSITVRIEPGNGGFNERIDLGVTVDGTGDFQEVTFDASLAPEPAQKDTFVATLNSTNATGVKVIFSINNQSAAVNTDFIFDNLALEYEIDPTSIISSFRSSLVNPVPNEVLSLLWNVDPDTTLTIDQGIGNVDANTTAGAGSIEVTMPDVSVPTTVEYVLTATKGAETQTRTVTIELDPVELSFDDLSDHFEGTELDTANWLARGNKVQSVADSKVTWAADGGVWATGEVTSVSAFPLPEVGQPTTITWTLAPASIDTPGTNAEGNSLRTQLGVVSAFDRNAFSLQHYSNTKGGIWLDVSGWSGLNTAGITGQFFRADDTKEINGNGTLDGDFQVNDWAWETESHEFSVRLTNLGYTWFSGENQIGSGLWADANLDTEFANGFRIMGMAGNWEDGKGVIAFDQIVVENGFVDRAPLAIQDFSYDEAGQMVTLSWNSKPDMTYALSVSSSLNGVWFEELDSVPSQGELTEITVPTGDFFVFLNGAPERAFLRISEVPSEEQ